MIDTCLNNFSVCAQKIFLPVVVFSFSLVWFSVVKILKRLNGDQFKGMLRKCHVKCGDIFFSLAAFCSNLTGVRIIFLLTISFVRIDQ